MRRRKITIKLPKIGETWRHYKGNKYLIINIVYGAEGENLGVRIVYGKPGEPLFSRPIEDFLGLVGEKTRFEQV